MKKILYSLILFAFTFNNAFANTWTNDARTLFQANKANIYVINVRTFSAIDSNKNEIIELELGEQSGTFTGATKRLKSLAENGINMIHLLPITPVGKIKALGTAGSLYAMDSFNQINPQLDDKTNHDSVYTEAKNFITEAHKYGIRVIIDMPSCGSYDMFLRKPNIFATNTNGKPITPADWKDVRLFKTTNENGSINNELYELHKSFIDMVKNLGADGIRADVATIKPYDFWKQLIAYARRDDSEFLFIAEASPEWTTPVAQEAEFTPYDKLINAGFDGYLGNFMNYLKFSNTEELFSAYNEAKKLGDKNNSKKSILLNFATHDDTSPSLVNSNYPSQILWLSATLPGNMYFVNGFISGDFYVYSYANQKANKTYTDDNFYYVHKGKHDIFNYSRRAGSINTELTYEYKLASTFKQRMSSYSDYHPNILKTSNKDIFAYAYETDDAKIIVILNHNPNQEVSAKVNYRGIENFDELVPIHYSKGITTYKNGKFDVRLAPSDIVVFVSNK